MVPVQPRQTGRMPALLCCRPNAAQVCILKVSTLGIIQICAKITADWRLALPKKINQDLNREKFMTYAYDFENGQRLIVQNDGGDTVVALSSDDEGQQQSQSTVFSTGRWSKTPELFYTRGSLVLRLESKEGVEFIRVRGSQIQLMRSEPDLENAEKRKLKKSDESVAMKPMEPMKPMKPMEPMKPMGSMRPMEMRMGDMHMSLGTREREVPSAKRFCTQCGAPAQSDDRFCASCGHALSSQK
jgi:hypothetical protein